MLPYQEKIISEILSATPIQGARILEIGGTPPWTVANKLIEMGAKSVTSINYRSDLENLRISDSIDFYNIDARIMSSVLKEKYEPLAKLKISKSPTKLLAHSGAIF
jgi:hypothetical protein